MSVAIERGMRLTEEHAAKYLGVAPGTLKNWRSAGQGPRYIKIHHRLIRYDLVDLDRFIEANKHGGPEGAK